MQMVEAPGAALVEETDTKQVCEIVCKEVPENLLKALQPAEWSETDLQRLDAWIEPLRNGDFWALLSWCTVESLLKEKYKEQQIQVWENQDTFLKLEVLHLVFGSELKWFDAVERPPCLAVIEGELFLE